MTGPRTPCATFGRWLRQERWVARFTEHGRTGAYLRVVVPGPVAAGDAVAVVRRPGHGVSVSRWFTAQDPADARTLLAHAADAAHPGDGGWRMADFLREYVERVAARA